MVAPTAVLQVTHKARQGFQNHQYKSNMCVSHWKSLDRTFLKAFDNENHKLHCLKLDNLFKFSEPAVALLSTCQLHTSSILTSHHLWRLQAHATCYFRWPTSIKHDLLTAPNMPPSCRRLPAVCFLGPEWLESTYRWYQLVFSCCFASKTIFKLSKESTNF